MKDEPYRFHFEPLGRGEPTGASALEILDSYARVATFGPGQAIGKEEDQLERWHRIVAGVARKCVMLSSGRRQILDLLLPGDFFGIEGEIAQYCYCEAVVDDTVVASYLRRDVESLADSDPRVAKVVRDMAFRAISRLQTQLFIRGRTPATAKVGSFLLNMQQRLADGPVDGLELPMSRYDIADYLAISVETVSRALTGLRHRGAITFSGARRLTILDHFALEDDRRRGHSRSAELSAEPDITARMITDHLRHNPRIAERKIAD
jgi:CRP-like cAMP-binding protein